MFGAAGGDRTHDPWLRRPILYPLSYSRLGTYLERCEGYSQLDVSSMYSHARPAHVPIYLEAHKTFACLHCAFEKIGACQSSHHLRMAFLVVEGALKLAACK